MMGNIAKMEGMSSFFGNFAHRFQNLDKLHVFVSTVSFQIVFNISNLLR